MFIIFDLDGTLANIEHRLHFIKRPNQKKDWDQFHLHCQFDSVIEPIRAVFQALRAQRYTIEIWSGRSAMVRPETENWLRQFNMTGYNQLLMRMIGDYRPDHELKELWLNQFIKNTGKKPDLVFDDRSRLVEMWRRNGIQCCQVAPGEF